MVLKYILVGCPCYLCWRKLSTSCLPRVRDSGFRKIFACGIRNLGKFYTWNLESWALESGIQLKESGILLTIRIQNPSSTDKDWNQVPGIRNPLCGIQNPRLSWIPLYEAILYRAFSVTCPAATQIYCNKRTFLHNKVILPQDWFGTLTWPPIHCFRA